MKIQLDEKTLNAYINEAVKQELNEAGSGFLGKIGRPIGNYFRRLGGNKALVKAGKEGIENSKKAISKADDEMAKISKQMKGVKDAQKANVKAHSALPDQQGANWGEHQRLGKEGSKLVNKERKLANQNAKQLAAKNDAEKAIKDSEKAIADAKAAARKTQIRTNAVIGAAGAGALGYALGRNHQNDPWNDTPDGQGGSNGNGNGTGGGNWNDTFPWDDTKPAWTPRKPKVVNPASSTGETQPTEPTQPERPKLEPLPTVDKPLAQPTGATTSVGSSIERPEPQLTLPQNAIRSMVNTAQASPTVASQREKNRALRQTRQNAIKAINSDSYGADNATKRADTKFVNDMYRTMKRGDQHPNL